MKCYPSQCSGLQRKLENTVSKSAMSTFLQSQEFQKIEKAFAIIGKLHKHPLVKGTQFVTTERGELYVLKLSESDRFN